MRSSATSYGPDRVVTFSNSQFLASIFNLAQKLAAMALSRKLHIVKGGSDE